MIFILGFLLLAGVSVTIYAFVPSKEDKENEALATKEKDDLEKKAISLNLQIKDLNLELEEKNKLTLELKDKDDQITSLKSDLEKMNSQFCLAKDNLTKQTEHYENLKESIELAQKDKTLAIEENEVSLKSIKVLESKISDQLDTQFSKTAETKDRDEEMIRLKAELNKLNFQLLTSTDRLQSQADYQKGLKDSVKSLEKDAELAIKEKEVQEKKSTSLNLQIKELNLELEEKNKLTLELKDKDDQITSLKSDLKKINSQFCTAKDSLTKQTEHYENLKESIELTQKDKTLAIEENEVSLKSIEVLKSKIKEFTDQLDDQSRIIEYLALEEKEELLAARNKREMDEYRIKARKQLQKKKIGEILLDNNFITKDSLDNALEQQKKFGGEVTRHLLASGCISEDDLAKCLSVQFKVPYLPIKDYEIADEIIKLVPVDIVEKYWLVPIDRMGDVISVVMVYPLDEQILKELEIITNCRIQPFVGIISDIAQAIESYYHVSIEGAKIQDKYALMFVDHLDYKGVERRASLRLPIDATINFIFKDSLRVSKIKDISPTGLMIESKESLPIGHFIVLQINLPEEFYFKPIAAVAQVMRIIDLDDGCFGVGLQLSKIPKEDLKLMLEYARIKEHIKI